MTDQLTKLADLRDRGGISAEELEREKAKAKVLAGLTRFAPAASATPQESGSISGPIDIRDAE